MPHKFILGQAVGYTPPPGLYAHPGIYVVTAKLPEQDGEFEYHIKHTSELHERIARESEIHEARRWRSARPDFASRCSLASRSLSQGVLMPILNASEAEPRIKWSRRAIRSAKLLKNVQELWTSERGPKHHEAPRPAVSIRTIGGLDQGQKPGRASGDACHQMKRRPLPTNLVRETWNNLDSGELRKLLHERFGYTLGQYASDDDPRLYLPEAGPQSRIALTYKGSKIAAIEPGQAFDAAEWKQVSQEIEHSILDGTPKTGRDYSFSSWGSLDDHAGRHAQLA
jgi:hypothetical protein